MTSSLASYYSNELDEWKDVINFHVQEIEEFDVWLNEVLQRNTLPNLAAQAEHFFSAFATQRHHLEQLAGEVYSLQDQLVKDDRIVEDEAITPAIENTINRLRDDMLETEKGFLDLKYSCNKFISDTLGRQNAGKEDDQTEGPFD